MNQKKAFSIVEVTVVIVIMGVLAAMAIPNYIVSLRRTNARSAVDNLLAIYAAQIVYAEANNKYHKYADDSVADDTVNLNQKLNLNITLDNETKYYCDKKAICHAVRTESAVEIYDIEIDLKLPLGKVKNTLVYCAKKDPDAELNPNPCCKDDGSKATTVCP